MSNFPELHAGSWRSFQLPLAVVLFALLASCGGTTVVERAGMGPHARHEGGTSLFVEAVETDGDLIKLDLLVINGTEKRIEVVDGNDPMVLQDKGGKQYSSATEKVTLEPYTSNNLKVSFAGPLADDGQTLTLRVNGKYGSRFGAPQLVVENIPISGGRRIEFATYKTNQVRLPDTTFHHANGLTFTLKEIALENNEARIAFSAVNGHANAVDLADSSSDRGFMQDEQGNRFYLVPAANNPKLSIPARQKLSGMLRFAGRPAPTTKDLRLHLNDKFGSDAEFSNSPKIIINNIPVQEVSR